MEKSARRVEMNYVHRSCKKSTQPTSARKTKSFDISSPVRGHVSPYIGGDDDKMEKTIVPINAIERGKQRSR